MELQKILNDITNGNGESGYVVIDVRGEDEVAYTGKISSHVHTLPLPLIAQVRVEINSTLSITTFSVNIPLCFVFPLALLVYYSFLILF